MSENKILFVGIDGLELSYLTRFDVPFWEEIKSESSIAKIPKPGKIESGEISTASSPRLWSRYATGVPPKEAGPMGFWEKIDEDGKVHRANVSIDWMREHRCEKLVDREDLLVDPIWSILLKNSKSVGIVTPWFSWPLQGWEKDAMDEDSFALTDFPFPREDLEPEENFWPEDAEPPEDFEDQVGAGARIPILASQKPHELVRRMKKQDEDRYNYALSQLGGRNPDFVGMYTRGVDGLQHILQNQENAWRQEGGFVREGETVNDSFADPSDLKEAYEVNMDGVRELWDTGKFDVLIMASDHGTSVLEREKAQQKAHHWPAYAILYSEDETIPAFPNLQGKYEDIPITILDLLDVDVPEYMTGDNLLTQAQMSENLRNLGYF